MQIDQADLVEAAKGGDRSAFDELVKTSYADVYTLAYRLTGNQEDARDVVQDTYLRAYKGLKRFRGDAQFSTWIYRITANCASTYMAKGRRQRHDDLDDNDQLIDERPEFDPESRADAAILRDRVEAALEQLPDKLRSVVVLRDIYDLTHEDIADQLGITVPAAKVRLHRARRKLREQLFPMPGEDSDEGTAHAV
jgi:RNA polymerase sigma-70 factor (ECF subfamily)